MYIIENADHDFLFAIHHWDGPVGYFAAPDDGPDKAYVFCTAADAQRFIGAHPFLGDCRVVDATSDSRYQAVRFICTPVSYGR